jgi:COMPASS component SWD3
LAATLDNTVRLWSYQAGRCLKTYRGHVNKRFCCFADFLSPGSDKFVISGSEDSKLYIWDLQSKACVATIDAHSGKKKRLI